MFLTYRGLSYKRNSSEVETLETNRFAIYRGIPYCIHRSTISQNNRSRKNLKYRGISYSTN
ncbi:MAG: DUF4278 domain-containing protein [Rivularia sp. (in: cyanobacteria)]